MITVDLRTLHLANACFLATAGLRSWRLSFFIWILLLWLYVRVHRFGDRAFNIRVVILLIRRWLSSLFQVGILRRIAVRIGMIGLLHFNFNN